MQLHFDKKEMEAVLEKAKKNVMVVGDQGVYFVADTHEYKKAPAICYARECNPETMSFDEWWNNKRRSWGGDDGVETLTKEEVEAVVECCADHMILILTPNSVTIKADTVQTLH